MTVKWNKQTFWDALFLSVLFFCGIGLLRFSKPVSAAVVHALNLCTDILLPSLFPFFVLSSLLVSSGIVQQISRHLRKPMRILFGLPACCSSAILLGAVGGYPVGARTVSMLYQQNLCSRQDAQNALLFCNNAGPAFLIGAIGSGLLNDRQTGIQLYLIHLLASLLIGLLGKSMFAKQMHHSVLTQKDVKQNSITDIILQSITSSFAVFINVCAFVLLFAVIMCLLQESGLLTLLPRALPFPDAFSSGLFCGFLELTTGADLLAHAGLPRRLLLPGLSLLCGWGGLSVQLQTISLLQETGLPCRRYLAAKVIHGVLAALLTLPLVF